MCSRGSRHGAAAIAGLLLLLLPLSLQAASGYRASYLDFTLDYGRRMSGGEYRRVFTYTSAACARLCLPLAVCKAFSYFRPTGSCALISRLSRTRPRSFFVTGVKIAPSPVTQGKRVRPAAEAGSAGTGGTTSTGLIAGMQLEYGVERLGRGDRVLRRQHAEDCARACGDLSSCVSFRYVPRQRECALFDSLVDSQPRLGRVSGFKVVGGQGGQWEQGGFALHRDVGLGGQDYRHRTLTDLAQCLEFCAADPQCQAFSFAADNAICALKQVVPLRRYRKGVISGFRQRRQ